MIRYFVKRSFDLVSSILLTVLLLPIFIGIILLIKTDSKGPAFYYGKRTGKDNVPFKLIKFRTMVVDADKIGGSSTADDDPRVTKIGKTLRKYKLDEIPQLINVIKGDMSIVGPRPEVEFYTNIFNDEEREILSVRPGITDWATIWNSDEGALLAGCINPDEEYLNVIRPIKIKLQLKYINEESFWTDIKIIFLTFLAIVRPTSKAIEEIRTKKHVSLNT